MLESIKKSPVKIGIILVVLIILNVVGGTPYLNWDKPSGRSTGSSNRDG